MSQPELNPEALLSAWEEGASQSPLRRALLLLSRVWPERSYEQWAAAAIGERDGALLDLRERVFGSRLDTVAVCPKCGEKLDVSFRTDDVRVGAANGPRRLDADGYRIGFRPPNSRDLLAVAEAPPSEARETLFRRCIESAELDGGSVEPASLPAEVKDAVVTAMAEADPQADLRVETTCAACTHKWPVAFDIFSYLWSEIEEWAHRLMLEVHTLASAYGWSEREILGLTARRRRLYLELLGG